VQVYASRPESAVERPARWLVGFAPVTAAPGATTQADITIPARAFADWTDNGWHYEPGDFTLHIGTSVGVLPLTAKVTVR
jgi:beta-glucosidase